MTADSPPAPPTARPSHAVPGKVDLDSKFHWGRLLGRGSYADVVLVHSLPPPSHPPDGPFTPVPFAMKIIDKRLIKSNHQLQELLREIRIMRRIRHPSVVRLEEVFETERKVYLQMEYVSGGELFDRIAERDHFSEREARDIVWQIVDALVYLHGMGVVHRDLKPENILTLPSVDSPPSPVPSSIIQDLANPSTITTPALHPPPPILPHPYPHSAQLTIKLADFGLATTLGFPPSSLLHPLKTQCGSFPYVAPEILVGNEHRGYGYEVDIWSLGVIAYVLLSGHFPFRPEVYSARDPEGHVDGDPHAPKPESTRRMLDRIMEGGWKKAMQGEGWEGVSEEGKEWVRKCLEVDPAQRWDAVTARDGKWFRIKLEGDEEGEEAAAKEAVKEEPGWMRVVEKIGEAIGGKSHSGAVAHVEHVEDGTAKQNGAREHAHPAVESLARPDSATESRTSSHSHLSHQTTSQKIGAWLDHLVHPDREKDAPTPPLEHGDAHGDPEQDGDSNVSSPPLSINTRKPTSHSLARTAHHHSWSPRHLVHRIRAHAFERRKVKEERLREVPDEEHGKEM